MISDEIPSKRSFLDQMKRKLKDLEPPVFFRQSNIAKDHNRSPKVSVSSLSAIVTPSIPFHTNRN